MVSGLDLPPCPSRSSSAFPLCHGEALLASGSGSCQNLCLFPFLEVVWGRGKASSSNLYIPSVLQAHGRVSLFPSGVPAESRPPIGFVWIPCLP